MTERVSPYSFPGVAEEKLRGLSSAEQDALIAAERSEWERTRPLEALRRAKRVHAIAAGGDAEKFDAWWTEDGEAAAVQERAAQREAAVKSDSVF